MHKIQSDELRLGEPARFAVFDEEGVLLLRKGYVLTHQSSVDRLLRDGVFRKEALSSATGKPMPSDTAEEAAVPTLQLIFHTRDRLTRAFSGLLAVGRVAGFPERMADMAAALQKAVAQNRDAALAAATLDVQAPYVVQQHMHAAVLTELLAVGRGLSAERRLPLVCAALSHDVAMLDVHAMAERKPELNEKQRAIVQHHSEAGRDKCRELGVEDDDWLEAIYAHHERLDGSGYPRKLADSDIAPGARILMVADSFSAMTRARPYRKISLAKDALRELYLLKERYAQEIIKLLVQEVGVFPPGAIVRLASNEVAVVAHMGEDRAHPVAYSFISQSGMPMAEAQHRDTSLNKYAIQSMEPAEKYRPHLPGLFKVWN